MTEYKLYIGNNLVQKHKDLSKLTLLNDDKYIKASYYHKWWIINPDGSRIDLPEFKKNIERNTDYDKIEEIIPNGPNGKNVRFIILHGMTGIIN
jgi:hypothetical protein